MVSVTDRAVNGNSIRVFTAKRVASAVETDQCFDARGIERCGHVSRTVSQLEDRVVRYLAPRSRSVDLSGRRSSIRSRASVRDGVTATTSPDVAGTGDESTSSRHGARP